MKKNFLIACVLVGAGLSTGAIAQQGDVKYRQAIMQAVSGHSGAIAEIAYGGVPHTDQLVGHARALLEVAKQATLAFKANSITDDPPTSAKPAIWGKWGEFEDKADALVQASTDVLAAAETGDLGAVAKALDPLWDACKGCHKPFRTKK